MNLNNYTIKAQEAVQKASEIAAGNQQQAIETAHILKGLLTVDENVISYLLKKLNVNINRISEVLDAQIQSFPKVSGSDIYLSPGANTALQKAQSYLKEFKDEFVSVEHILLGLLSTSDKVSSILKDAGVNQTDLKKAILELEALGRKKRVAYMCSEAVWWSCHRSLVSDFLKNEGWTVTHIMGLGKGTEHPFTAPANIVDGKLNYEKE